MAADDAAADEIRREDLAQAVTHLLEEARMVLPGVQALFGFQLMAIFSAGFARLAPGQRLLHLAAVCVCLLCMITILAPAAYHRQAEPRMITGAFHRYASAALALGMAWLLVALALDFHLLARVILPTGALAGVLTGGFVTVAGAVWFLHPWCLRRRRARRSPA